MDVSRNKYKDEGCIKGTKYQPINFFEVSDAFTLRKLKRHIVADIFDGVDDSGVEYIEVKFTDGTEWINLDIREDGICLISEPYQF